MTKKKKKWILFSFLRRSIVTDLWSSYFLSRTTFTQGNRFYSKKTSITPVPKASFHCSDLVHGRFYSHNWHLKAYTWPSPFNLHVLKSCCRFQAAFDWVICVATCGHCPQDWIHEWVPIILFWATFHEGLQGYSCLTTPSSPRLAQRF